MWHFMATLDLEHADEPARQDYGSEKQILDP